MQFAVIGYGAFGRLHAQCIHQLAETDLVAIGAHGAASAAAAAADFPAVAIYRDYRELLANAEVEAVSVVVPNHLHAEIGIAALAAGKDILLEKPMATTLADCDALLAAAQRHDKQISVGFELRVSQQWGAIKQFIDDGAIGRPYYANLSLFRHPYRPGADGWRHDPARVGSWILEEPIHFIDLLMWYFAALGDPIAVRAAGTVSAKGRGTYDSFSTTLTFPQHAYATISQSLAGFGHHLVLEIAGDQGAIRSLWSAADARSLQPQYELQMLRSGEELPERITVEKSGEVYELAEQIRRTSLAFEQRRSLVSGVEARKRMVVCLEAERALIEARERALSV